MERGEHMDLDRQGDDCSDCRCHNCSVKAIPLKGGDDTGGCLHCINCMAAADSLPIKKCSFWER